jgi:hypothetical protein
VEEAGGQEGPPLAAEPPQVLARRRGEQPTTGSASSPSGQRDGLPGSVGDGAAPSAARPRACLSVADIGSFFSPPSLPSFRRRWLRRGRAAAGFHSPSRLSLPLGPSVGGAKASPRASDASNGSEQAPAPAPLGGGRRSSHGPATHDGGRRPRPASLSVLDTEKRGGGFVLAGVDTSGEAAGSPRDPAGSDSPRRAVSKESARRAPARSARSRRFLRRAAPCARRRGPPPAPREPRASPLPPGAGRERKTEGPSDDPAGEAASSRALAAPAGGVAAAPLPAGRPGVPAGRAGPGPSGSLAPGPLPGGPRPAGRGWRDATRGGRPRCSAARDPRRGDGPWGGIRASRFRGAVVEKAGKGGARRGCSRDAGLATVPRRRPGGKRRARQGGGSRGGRAAPGAGARVAAPARGRSGGGRPVPAVPAPRRRTWEACDPARTLVAATKLILLLSAIAVPGGTIA